MAIAVRGVGVVAAGNVPPITVPQPTSGNAPQAGDAIYLFVESANGPGNLAGTPSASGYSKLFEETQGAGVVGATTLTVFGKIAAGSDADVSLDGWNDHALGRILVISGHGLNVIGDTVVGTGNGANSGSATMLGITVTAGSMVLMVCGITRDLSSTTNFSAWTNVNLTNITEQIDNTTPSGIGGGVGVATADCAGTTTGDSTVTIAVSEQWRAVHLGVPPPSTSTQVQNLIATAASSDQIDLTWNDVGVLTGETFDIERDGNVIVYDHPTNSYSDTGLDPNTQYTYRVRAVAP